MANYDKEQKKTYYQQNKKRILKRLADNRDRERLVKKDKGLIYDQAKKAPDIVLEKQALAGIIKNAPEFRKYIKELYDEAEKNKLENDSSVDE